MTGILCWFCDVCATMTLLERVERDECIQAPRRADCPLPIVVRGAGALALDDLAARVRRRRLARGTGDRGGGGPEGL